jgi:hypothetical protein
MFVIKTLPGVGKFLDQINSGAKQITTIVIEDLTHYFSKRVVDELNVKGYDKWTKLAADTKIHIIDKESELRPNLTIIVIGHVTASQDASGNVSVNIQTPGKLMDNSIKIPSYFTYVLHTVVGPDADGIMAYKFLTNKDGVREAKMPEEMFPQFIDNDYQQVIDGIVKYQNEEGITPIGLSVEEKAKLDAAKPKPTGTVAAAPLAPKAPPAPKVEEPETKEEPVEEIPEVNTEATTGQEVAK